jgi:hypothetical protein
MWNTLIWLSPQRNLAFLAVTNLGTSAAFLACDTVVEKLIGIAQAERKKA